MRLLIACALVSGCYDPPLEDCQFRCGANNACPNGTSCDGNGFCRVNASGECQFGDAGNDAPVCPAQPSGCDPVFTFPGGCGTICRSSRAHSDARDKCGDAGWQLAVLDTPAKLAAVPAATGDFWVGARDEGSNIWRWENTTIVAIDAWEGNVPPLTGDSCALVGAVMKRLHNRAQCGDDRDLVCTFPVQ